MVKVAITRQGTRSVDVKDLMQARGVKDTLRFVATKFEGLPGPQSPQPKRSRQKTAPKRDERALAAAE